MARTDNPTRTGSSLAALWPVFTACFLAGLHGGAAMPLISLALEKRGEDNLTIGVVGAVWGVGMLASTPFLPWFAQRLGTVPLILVSVLIGAGFWVALALTDSTPAWFVICLLSGTVGAVPWVASEIWLNMVVEERLRGRLMAAYAALMALGLASGPLVLQVVGVYGPLPFLVCAALGLAVALPLLLRWHDAPRIVPEAGGGFRAILIAAPLAMLAGLTSGLGEQTAFNFLPVYAVGAGTSAETGALWLSLFVVGNIVLQWPIGWAADHMDRRLVLAACGFVCTALVLVLPALSATSWSVVPLLLVWGGVSFAIYPVGLALLGQRFSGGDIARANAAFSMIYVVGGLIGRPITGGAMDWIGPWGMGLSFAAFYALAGVAALLALRRAA